MSQKRHKGNIPQQQHNVWVHVFCTCCMISVSKSDPPVRAFFAVIFFKKSIVLLSKHKTRCLFSIKGVFLIMIPLCTVCFSLHIFNRSSMVKSVFLAIWSSVCLTSHYIPRETSICDSCRSLNSWVSTNRCKLHTLHFCMQHFFLSSTFPIY